MRLDLRSLGFAYPTSGPVIRDLDLTVESGSFHALVGPSGCGKTTLLRVLAGLETATVGSFELVGERRREFPVSVVFQTPRLLPWWEVERNVAIGAEFSDKPREIYERIKDLYTSLVGLAGLGKRMPNTLSGGQRSRAGVGRALAHDADVLLLDEPFAHLDALARRKMCEEMELLWMADRRTALLVTHDIEEAVMLADRVSVMSAGPGPLVGTIEVDAPRPRHRYGPAEPGIRRAVGEVWEVLERGGVR